MSEAFPYPLLKRNQLISKINELAGEGQAFIFVLDYKAQYGYIITEEDIDNQHIKYSFETTKTTLGTFYAKKLEWQTKPVTYSKYSQKFNFVRNEIQQGNSFLVNLTQPTELETNYTTEEIYEKSTAAYKLWIKGQFVVLSPETFIKISDAKIASYPMKGTIDASIANAESLILNDVKEKAEHATIVDLIRNDLSIFADKVEVSKYRYIDRLTTNKGELLQVSSEITGNLPQGYEKKLGEILFSLLPAGSITGAPKPKTMAIIDEIEGYNRGFYTGIFGRFDGKNLVSSVMIRFIEEQANKLIFKSGGGITSQSDCQKEYDELIRKVYVPFY